MGKGVQSANLTDEISTEAINNENSETVVTTDIPPANNNALAEAYLEQLQTPVVLRDGDLETINFYVNTSQVGCLKNLNTLISKPHPSNITPLTQGAQPSKDVKAVEANFKQPKDLLDRSAVTIAREGDKLFEPDNIAYQDRGKIVLQDFQGQVNEKTIPINQEYQKGNTFAQLSILYHELTHFKHYKYDHCNELTLPIDRYKCDRLTEKIAATVQYQNAAQLYSILKEQKVTKFEINGEVKPIESILEPFDGLKEYLMQNSYSPNNKKDVRAVTEIACNWWNDKRQNVYLVQDMKAAGKHTAHSMFNALETDRKRYDGVTKNMLKDLYIGNNTNIDLSHCRDLLDDISDEKVLQNIKSLPIDISNGGLTYGQAVEISNYLEQKGLHTEEEKLNYLNQNYNHIVLRDGEYDKDLEKLLLDISPASQRSIIYADGLIARYDEKGMYALVGKKGKADMDLYYQTRDGNAQIAENPTITPTDNHIETTDNPDRDATKQQMREDALKAQKILDNFNLQHKHKIKNTEQTRIDIEEKFQDKVEISKVITKALMAPTVVAKALDLRDKNGNLLRTSHEVVERLAQLEKPEQIDTMVLLAKEMKSQKLH